MKTLCIGIGRPGDIIIEDLLFPSFKCSAESLHLIYSALPAVPHCFPELAAGFFPVSFSVYLSYFLDYEPRSPEIRIVSKTFIKLFPFSFFKLMRRFPDDLLYREFLFMHRLQAQPEFIRQLQGPLYDMKMVYDYTGIRETFLRYPEVKGIHIYTDFPDGVSYVRGDSLQFFLTCF